jgi:hypothetical protein
MFEKPQDSSGSPRNLEEISWGDPARPGKHLKHPIPIRTFADWNEAEPGFIEIDLVGHDGGTAKGDFALTLVVTDIHTGWTEMHPVKNRARIWTHQALEVLMERFPFPIKGIDCDNDSAFINHHLITWCREKGITFTRSRPYKKNDNCYVEQKNGHVARRLVGHFRYDTPEALEVLEEVERAYATFVNFFKPTMKRVEKERVDSKVRKRYDTPKTPYQRVLEEMRVPEKVKENLRERFAQLHVVQLRKRILSLQDRLFSLATPPELMKEDLHALE